MIESLISLIIFIGAKSNTQDHSDHIYPYLYNNVRCYGNEINYSYCHYEISSFSLCYDYSCGDVTILCQKSECIEVMYQ